MAKAVNTAISERVADNIREIRLARKWSMAVLSMQLHDHRCALHANGYDMSPAIINSIENGVSAQHGYPARTRPVTVDELFVFAEVLGVKPADLLR